MANEIPQMPQNDLAIQCRKVLRLSNSLEPDIREIAQQAQDIPVLSDAVLQAVNSAGMGLQRTIYSVNQAVALLGARRMCDVIEHVLDGRRVEEVALRGPHQRRVESQRTA